MKSARAGSLGAVSTMSQALGFGVQQSPASAVTVSARRLISQLLPVPCCGSTTSPKSLARESQMAASSTSLADRPWGLWVVQRMNVTL